MKRLTLQRRFLLHNLLLVAGLVAAGGISVWRLGTTRRQVSLSRNVYAELRTIRDVGIEVGIARGLLSGPQSNRDLILSHLKYAVGGLDQFIQIGKGYGGDESLEQAYDPINRSAATARARLQQVLGQFEGQPAGVPADGAAAVEAAMKDLDNVASSCLQFVSSRQEAASADLAENGLLVGVFSLAGAAAAGLLSVLQYRMVMLPLRRLRQGVRRVAEAQFSQKLDPTNMGASPEFLDLALEFNRMAGELDDFYRRLEEQVRTKSRELVRSERLASVGFLAAGVAHEINNPLNIISGYAELTTRQLGPGRGPLGEEAVAQARESLRIIRDEAFRCKDITEKLLSLSRSGSEERETLDLAGVVRDVAMMTRGLKNYRDRRLTLNLDPHRPLQVQANLTEMKQVLLNLTINALESVPVAGGEVCIEGRQSDSWVELSVKDNGLGMSPEVLRHVFEPFFTVRRSGDRGGAPAERGTGLGLSITHAIVESHGGTIRAQSDGPGKGARFTISLPARA